MVRNQRWSSEVFDKFKCCAELQCEVKVKILQTDNTLEFKKLTSSLTARGVKHRLSIPYSHQKMNYVERRHRHVVDTTITLLNHTSIPKEFWDYATLVSCYLYNRNPSQTLKGIEDRLWKLSLVIDQIIVGWEFLALNIFHVYVPTRKTNYRPNKWCVCS